MRRLREDEMRLLYETDLRAQFSPMETRPWRSMQALLRKGAYQAYALTDGQGQTLCYAFLLLAGRTVLLDYLATPDPWKNQGYGRELLCRLRSEYEPARQILIESEDPNALQGDAAGMAVRRLGFYERCGFSDSGVGVRLFGVAYRILSDSADTDRSRIVKHGIKGVYRLAVPACIRWLVARVHDG